MRVRNDVNFAIIPEWILYADLSPQAIRLYCVLHRHADKQGRSHPSRNYLKEKLRVKSPRTVDQALKELEDIGAVTRRARKTARGDQTSNEYTLHVVPFGAQQIAMGGATDDQTPLAADVAQNESQSELKTSPTPSPSEGTDQDISRSEARTVACPTCGANPGDRCIGKRSKTRESNHRERVVAYLAGAREAEAEAEEALLVADRANKIQCSSCGVWWPRIFDECSDCHAALEKREAS